MPPIEAESVTLPPPTPLARPLSLPEAIDLAYQNNPRLRVAMEAIDQARGGEDVAFAPFLPTVVADARYVGASERLDGFAGADVPFIVSFAGGVNEFQLNELRLQWTVWDFGRRMGRYQQAMLKTDIAALQYQRARQTVAFDVTAAYFRVLQTRARRRIEEQTVRRSEALLKDARNLLDRGAVDRNFVLRAEVQLAESRQLLVSARSTEAVALASLNLAMGWNVSAAADVADQAAEPQFSLPLAACLQLAVDNRREFEAARRSVSVSEQGLRVAKADFKPYLYVRGSSAHAIATGGQHEDVQVGGIHVSMNLFEGGRRLGETRSARAGVRAAAAQAQQICDGIAFEVNQAFYSLEDARERITLSRTTVTQAAENLRLVKNKRDSGDATPTEVIEAETLMTRTQQTELGALYDYQSALARLIYAMGTPQESTFVGPGCPAPVMER